MLLKAPLSDTPAQTRQPALADFLSSRGGRTLTYTSPVKEGGD
jgi:hypothetical protein